MAFGLRGFAAFGLGVRPKGVTGGTPPAPTARISAISGAGYGNGWEGTWASGTPPTLDPNGAPLTDTVSRAGFTAAGAATTYSDTVIYTQRVREAFTGSVVLTSNKVALSDYVYADDAIAGVTNNCTLSSPKPICKWLLADQVMVGGSIHVEVAAFHRNARNGKQVACVVVTCDDGLGNVFSRIITNSTVSTARANDQGAVLAYQADFTEVAGFPDDRVWTVNAKAYPWFGVAASVADSSTGTAGARGFVPQKFWKNAARLAAPPLAYVTATGNDGTGVVSTNPATAKANGFQTVKAAIEALRTFTGNVVDGCRLRISNVTTSLAASTASATYSAGKAAFVIEGDPAESKASNVFTIGGASNVSIRTGYTRFEGNLTIQRLTAFQIINIGAWIFGGPAGAPDYIATNDNPLTNSGSVPTYVEGLNCSSIGGSTFNYNTANDNRLFRGLVSPSGTFELQCVVGCKLSAATLNVGSAARSSGGIIAFNRFMKIGATFFGISVTGTIDGIVNAQNLFEFTSASPNPSNRPSGDGAATNVTHLCEFNNTYAGANDCGRANFLYDETTGTYRSHILCTRQGVGDVALNYKSDQFLYLTQPIDGPLHTGTWSIMYGVGWRDIWTQYRSANGDILGGRFAVEFPGLNASIGTSNSTKNDPLFVAPACTTTTNGTTYTAGPGDGNYRLQSGSPWRGRQSIGVLPFDLEGNARSAANDTIGALAA